MGRLANLQATVLPRAQSPVAPCVVLQNLLWPAEPQLCIPSTVPSLARLLCTLLMASLFQGVQSCLVDVCNHSIHMCCTACQSTIDPDRHLRQHTALRSSILNPQSIIGHPSSDRVHERRCAVDDGRKAYEITLPCHPIAGCERASPSMVGQILSHMTSPLVSFALLQSTQAPKSNPPAVCLPLHSTSRSIAHAPLRSSSPW